jgi:hypothetical protein
MASSLSSKSLDALQKQRVYEPMRLTGENRPDIAYFNMGHGGELNDENEMKIVPKGCIFVLKARPGDLNLYEKNLLDERLCNPENQSLFLDPIKNYKKLNDMFDTRPVGVHQYNGEIYRTKKSLAIYREYDRYPETKYYLLSIQPTAYIDEETDDSEHSYDQSGFLNSYDLTKCRKRPEIFIKNKDLTIDFIVSLFIDSFFPGPDYIRDILNNGVKTFKRPHLPLWYKILYIIYTDKYTNILQSVIFEMVKDGTNGFKQGVYYDLNCRYFLNANEKSAGPIKLSYKSKMAIREALFHRGPVIPFLDLDHINHEKVPVNWRNYRVSYNTKNYYKDKEIKNKEMKNNIEKIESYYKTHAITPSIYRDEPNTLYLKNKNGRWAIKNTSVLNESPSPPLNEANEPISKSRNLSPSMPASNKIEPIEYALVQKLSSSERKLYNLLLHKARTADPNKKKLAIQILKNFTDRIKKQYTKIGGTRKNRLRNKRRTLRKLVY